MSHLKLHVTDEPTAQAFLSICNEYLRPDDSLSPSTAAEAVAKLVPSEPDSVEDFLWNFWAAVDEIICQIPADDSAQDDMVALIQSLAKMPSRTITVWGEEAKLWSGLPIMSPCFRERFSHPMESVMPKDVVKSGAWVNKNAFYARLAASKTANTPGLLYAIWALRLALEDKPPDSGANFDSYVSAAAQWLTYAGLPILAACKGDKDETIDKMTKPGPLFEGPTNFSMDRWSFWKSRFRNVAGSVQDPEARTLALNASTNMEGLELN